jgi:hypothetical protein
VFPLIFSLPMDSPSFSFRGTNFRVSPCFSISFQDFQTHIIRAEHKTAWRSFPRLPTSSLVTMTTQKKVPLIIPTPCLGWPLDLGSLGNLILLSVWWWSRLRFLFLL